MRASIVKVAPGTIRIELTARRLQPGTWFRKLPCRLLGHPAKDTYYVFTPSESTGWISHRYLGCAKCGEVLYVGRIRGRCERQGTLPPLTPTVLE